MNASPAQNERPSFRPIAREFLEPLDESRLYASQDVVFVGYPDGIFDARHNLPLIRKGSIASVPSVDFNGLGRIIIDAQVFKGSSGSPVFVALDGTYRLLGVISENFVSAKQLDPIALDGKGKQAKMYTHLGLGVVIKQRHVIELIEGAVENYVKLKR